jgi:hypothetical protein
MALAYYDETQTVISGSEIRDSFSATTGSIVERKLHIRNDDPLLYYTNISVAINQDTGTFGSSGFSIKLSYGSRQPTEAEWDAIPQNTAINLPDIGASGAADTSTYEAFWVRSFCPAGFSLSRLRSDIQFVCTFQDFTA